MNSKAKSSNITTSTATANTSTLNEATSNMIVFDKHGCSTLLKKYPQLKSSIIRTVTTQLENGLFKSKFATALRWHGLPIRECRVNANEPGAVRVAFVIDGDTTTIIYLSHTLQKRAFTTELDRFLGKKSS